MALIHRHFEKKFKMCIATYGNRYALLPTGHSAKLNEDYNNIKAMLKKLDREFQQWLICVDLHMVNFLLGQQSGYTKYPCFICPWDSRACDDHWMKKGGLLKIS